MTVLSTIDRLAQQERASLRSEFLSPRLSGQNVALRVSGVAFDLAIKSTFSGWGVFRATDFRHAEFVREATAQERERYLSLFPAVRLIVTADGRGVQANRGDARLSIQGEAPIGLVRECELFDTVVTRFDGQQFWFDCADRSRPPLIAERMRESLAELLPLSYIAGSSAEERDAYASVLARRKVEIELAQQQTAEGRLSAAVRHAGGKLQSFIERDDGYTIRYQVDGQAHTSVVDKGLRVRAAGICLSGRDADFDLGSLVAVLKEGQRERKIYRVGINQGHGGDEDNY